MTRDEEMRGGCEVTEMPANNLSLVFVRTAG